MFNSKSVTNFNVALVALSEQHGSEKAVDLFFDVLDRKVESNKAEKIVKSFFKELNIPSGSYENYRYENESLMKKALAEKLSMISNQSRIL